MKKIIQYIHEYGLLRTIMQIFKRIGEFVGVLKSKTYVLDKEIQKDLDVITEPKYQIRPLGLDDIEEFNRMKYFDFLDPKNIIESKNKGAIIALNGSRIIGYVCYDSSSEHSIHKMGKWNLDENEAWVGPTYVDINYRNKGIHRDLLNETIKKLHYENIKNVFTAINYKNEPSVKSFEKTGFRKLGLISIRNILNFYKSIKIDEYIINSIRSKFYGNRRRKSL